MKRENKLGKLVALGSIIVNGFIFALKALIGIQIGSIALLSDAVHTISDSASSVAVYVGLKISEKPPDEQHPFGHGRAEQVAVLAVGIILFITALTFFSDGIQSFLTGPEALFMKNSFYIYILLTAVAKEVMGEASYLVGRKTGSDSLKADAWHHRADALTTLVVVGAIYASGTGYPWLDPAVGVGIALLLGYIGVSYVKKSTYDLLGTGPSSELLEEIRTTANELEGVKGVHDIKVHDYGGEKAASLHMEAENGNIRAAHETSHKLEKKLEEEVVSSTEIHLDPASLPREEIVTIIKENAEESDDIEEAHAIEVTESEEGCLISMHILLPKDISIDEGHSIGTEFEEKIKEEIEEGIRSDVNIQVHIEPCEGEGK
ncbi:MAG: cation diffusion facilitator family transporter [Candidatus Thermoplasmatota archaeon]|nr:cation diffusion facilitator family transporter [Candidatus Thermoplasmatota archaeon]